jgi:type IV pilus assembly protein PilA
MKIGKFMRKFRKQFRYGEKGFTLVELLIVVAILGILAALIIPNVATFMESGRVGAARAELSTLQVAVDGCMADAGQTALDGAEADWDGTAGANDPTATSAGGNAYIASDYVRRSPTDGLYDVTLGGVVTCASYQGNSDADFLAKVNEGTS